MGDVLDEDAFALIDGEYRDKDRKITRARVSGARESARWPTSRFRRLGLERQEEPEVDRTR